MYFDFRVNYLHNHELERPMKTEFVIENLNIYQIILSDTKIELRIVANHNAEKHKSKRNG